MTAQIAAHEPTQASIRLLLRGMFEEVMPGEGMDTSRARSSIAADADRAPDPRQPLPSVAYLLPGLPPEGSGGSHSLVQEARGLRELGARASVCVPADALQTAAAVYGNDDELFVPYAESVETVAQADVVVATEYPSVDLLARLRRARPGVLCAYYVQDYEPLFAELGSPRSDRALLSYRAIPRMLLFAKTAWLCGLVGALHGVAVAKVAPSLDRALFHARTRMETTTERDEGVVRVAAMIRPRTLRRRPTATLHTLALLAGELGSRVRITTFGCDEASFAEVGGYTETAVRHLGLLSRGEVAELMRRSDVFIDASAYQAFGRTGLEAMACGAVPLLPALGGVDEYARDGENSLILADDDPAEVARVAIALAREPGWLRRMRATGIVDAECFSIERAARSQLALFGAAAAARSRPRASA